jgi:hypothetical protein
LTKERHLPYSGFEFAYDPLPLMPPWSQAENRQGWTPTLPDMPVQIPAGVAGETEESA